MSKTMTVKRSELGRLRMTAGNERKYNAPITGGDSRPVHGLVGEAN